MSDPTNLSIQYMVFTDLDGTLLDHDTYSHADAQPTLKRLRDAGVPVIPTTSKTYAELIHLREEIGLKGPFIVENGAAIHIPHGFLRQKPANTQWQGSYWVRQFISRKHYWVKLLEKVGSQYKGQFTHFSAMSLDEICDSTGLTKEQAKRAADRQYGEPVLWLGDTNSKAKFATDIRLQGARPLQGGRFLHVSGECDKGMAMRWLVNECQRQNPNTKIVAVALGDGGNDIAMLEAADIAIRITSPAHPPPQLNKTEQVFTSTWHGPRGWAEMLEKHLLSNL